MNLREEIGKSGIALGSLVAITLLEGVNFDMIASSFPCAYRSKSESTNEGEVVSGYVIGIGEGAINPNSQHENKGNSQSDYLELHPSPNPHSLNLGGFRVYDRAIHSIRNFNI